MFGGNTKTGRLNDVYIMTLDGINVVINYTQWFWQQLQQKNKQYLSFQNFKKMKKYGPWPKKRSSHAACVLNYDQEYPQLLVAGGLDENTQALGDLWLLSVDHGMWIKV